MGRVDNKAVMIKEIDSIHMNVITSNRVQSVITKIEIDVMTSRSRLVITSSKIPRLELIGK